MDARGFRFGWVLAGTLAAAVAFTGPLGCDDDDHDENDAAATTTVVTTNAATGAVTTNVVATGAGDVAGGGAPPPGMGTRLDVSGYWTGTFQGSAGNGTLDLDLAQAEDTITGPFLLNAGGPDQAGSIAGSIDGDHLTMLLMVAGTGKWMELDGHVNAGATDYSGSFSGDWGSGSFDLEK